MPVLQQHKYIFWHYPTNHQSSACPIWPFCQQKKRGSCWQCLWIQYDFSQAVCWFSWWREKESGESRKRLLWEMKLIDFSKHPRWLEKESSVLSKRIVGAKRENRRFFLKESSVLMGSKSIYSPKSLNCYVSGGNNTWQKHSKMALMYSSNFIGWMTSAFSRAALSTIGQLPCRQSG